MTQNTETGTEQMDPRSVVVGVDTSENAARAAEWAAREAWTAVCR